MVTTSSENPELSVTFKLSKVICINKVSQATTFDIKDSTGAVGSGWGAAIAKVC